LLDPFIDPSVNGPSNAVFTDASGNAQIGALFDSDGEGPNLAGELPSGFYVIDVNVSETFFDGETNVDLAVDENFGQGYPDRPITCSADGVGTNPIVVTVESQLPNFEIGAGGFQGATVEVFVEDSSTGQGLPNLTLSMDCINFFGDPFSQPNAITNSFGVAEFPGLSGGECVISFAGSASFQPGDTFAFVPPGFSGFFETFLPLSPN